MKDKRIYSHRESNVFKRRCFFTVDKLLELDLQRHKLIQTTPSSSEKQTHLEYLTFHFNFSIFFQRLTFKIYYKKMFSDERILQDFTIF